MHTHQNDQYDILDSVYGGYFMMRWTRSTDQPSDDEWTEVLDIWVCTLELRTGGGAEYVDSDAFEVPVGTPPRHRFSVIESEMLDRNNLTHHDVGVAFPREWEL